MTIKNGTHTKLVIPDIKGLHLGFVASFLSARYPPSKGPVIAKSTAIEFKIEYKSF